LALALLLAGRDGDAPLVTAPIVRWLDHQARGTGDAGDVALAFAAPPSTSPGGGSSWAGASGSWAASAWPKRWHPRCQDLPVTTPLSILAATLSGGMPDDARALLRHQGLARARCGRSSPERLPATEERQRLVRPVTLFTKLVVAMVGVTSSVGVLAVVLAQVHVADPLEDKVTTVQARLLQQLFTDPEIDEATLAATRRLGRELDVATEVMLLDQ